jgi:ABC-type dipeptide/oligopeptide/nickel transport system permease component
MIRFLLRRFVTMGVTLLIISALVFFIIKLPPGDFLTNQIAELRAKRRLPPRPSSWSSNTASTGQLGNSTLSGSG